MDKEKDTLGEVKAASDMKSTESAPICAETESSANALAEASGKEQNTAEVCPETESPVPDRTEATDRAQAKDVCAEKESPAADVARQADMITKNIYLEMSKDQLLSALKKIICDNQLTANREVTQIKQRFFALKTAELDAELAAYVEAGNPVDAFASMPDPVEIEFKEALAEFKEKRSAYLVAEEERKAQNLILKNKIIEHLRSLSEDIDNINLHFPKFKQLQVEFKEISDIPESAVAETWKAFQQVVEQFYDRFMMNKELRDLDFKKNLEIKRELIEEARKLAEESDVVVASRRLQDLHAKWRETGPVAKELRDEIWEEFKQASTVVNKRHQEYFESRKEAEKANEVAKTELCEKIEAIDLDSIDSFAKWNELTNQVLELQAEWKKLGFASKKVNNILFARFRKVCDDFFARKSEAFKKNKEELSENLRKKIELCEKAEALKESADIKEGIEKVTALQAEWKTIGAVPRKNNESVWNRFREACNYFFDERKKQNASTRIAENENLKIKQDIIAELKKIDLEGSKDEALALVRELQAKWRATGFVPIRKKEKIQGEYKEAVDAVYSKLDVRQSRERMSRFEDKVARIAADGTLGRERERLNRQLSDRKNELKNYENNMLFFNVKSSQGNAMVKEMEKKMERLKRDIEEIQQKISLLDSKND